MRKAGEAGGARDDDRSSVQEGLAAGEWFWETDPDHRFTYFSNDGSVTTGLHGSNVIGKRRDELAEDPQDERWLAHLADLEAHRPFRGFEYTVRCPDGGFVELSVSGEPRYGEDGEFLGYRGAASDVTARKRAEQELRDTVGLVQALLEAAPFEIAVKDSEGRYLHVNPVWEAWHGRPRNDVFGMSTTDIFPADVSRPYAALDREALEGDRIIEKEEILKGADGTARNVLAVRFPVPIGDSGRPGIGLISVDITGQKRTELALREREAELRTIADNLPVLITRFDRVGRFQYINRAGETWYGRPADEIIGKTIPELFSPESCAKVLPRIERALNGEVVRFEESMQYPDGTGRDVEIAYVPELSPDGEVRGCIALVQDITDRKSAERRLRQSEAELRMVANNLPAFIAYIDAEKRFRFVNRVVEEWYGRPASEILGRTVQEVLKPQTYEILGPKFDALLEGHRMQFEDTVEYPDGRYRTVSFDWVPDMDSSGRVRGWFSLLRDITQRKRIEAELLRKERLAAMGELTGTVAHELRNPLGAVASSISVIRARSAGKGIDLERSLARAERGIARCDRIITELLDFARAKGLQCEPTLGGDWLRQVLEDYEFPDGIALSVDLPQEDVSVMLDHEAGRRAVINLVDNACQAYAPEGDAAAPVAGVVEIRARCEQGRFVIEVQDYGPGIPPELRSQVCDPLFTTKSFGTGLGLPTVRRIAEEHGGELTIESEEGRGTVARLTLPVGESLPGDAES